MTVPAAVLVALLAAAPVVVGDLSGLTTAVLLFTAAGGLIAPVGWAGLPSLGQGAFVGIGAYAVAIASSRWGWGPLASVPFAIAVAAAAGWVTGAAVARLRAPFAALATWLVSWAFALAVLALPEWTAGARGLVVPTQQVELRAFAVSVRITELLLYDAALVLAIVVGVVVVRARARIHPPMAFARDDPAGALAARIPVARLRTGAMAASAAVGGAAGALLVMADGVADPAAYGPVLSLQLFLVVVVGGAETVVGAAMGLAVLAVIEPLADAFASPAWEPLLTGALLVAVVAFGRRPLWRLRRRRFNVLPAAWSNRGVPLSAADVVVDYGGVRALDGVSVAIGAGTCHALVGPNGSGKTTLLRVLAQDPHAARTIQRSLTLSGLSVFDAVLAGREPVRTTGVLRWVLNTPKSRADQAAAEAAVANALSLTGLPANDDVADLHGAQRRLLQIAVALASEPGALLLDEPSAGMAPAEQDGLRAVLQRLRDGGLTVVVIEHNQRVVHGLADDVTELDAGRVVVSA